MFQIYLFQCCDGQCLPCEKVCGKYLSCGKHKCTSLCHTGLCYPCTLQASVKCRYVLNNPISSFLTAQPKSSIFWSLTVVVIRRSVFHAAVRREPNHQDVYIHVNIQQNAIIAMCTIVIWVNVLHVLNAVCFQTMWPAVSIHAQLNAMTQLKLWLSTKISNRPVHGMLQPRNSKSRSYHIHHATLRYP